jgi:hypothetical protein
MMKRVFRWTLYGFAIYFILAFIAMFLGVAMGEGSSLYNVSIGLIAAVMCTLPFLVLTSIVTGIGSLMQRNHEGKQKRGLMPYMDYDDAHLERIMNRLSPQDRTYLERRLADREVGLSDDGEIVSLGEFEEKSKRDW